MLTISLISLKIFWICEWSKFFQKLDIWDFNLSIRMRQFRSELSKIWFFQLSSANCYKNYRKNRILLTHYSHKFLHLMHQFSPKSEIGFRFMIHFDHLSILIKWHSIYIFFTTTIQTPSPLSFIPKHTKSSYLLLSWVLVK